MTWLECAANASGHLCAGGVLLPAAEAMRRHGRSLVARSDKAAAVAELTEEFRGSSGAVLTEYRGLTVKQLQELRRSLADNATYAVVKNTLTQIAAKDAGVDAFDGQLSGPSAIAFITGDAVLAAKGLRDFARANPALVIKAGIFEGKPVTPAEIATIADLESREVLLAKLAGAMTASLQGAVSMFAAPLSQVARLADALRAHTEATQGLAALIEPPAEESTAAAPAAEPAAPESAEAAPDAGTAGSAPAAEAPADVPGGEDQAADTQGG